MEKVNLVHVIALLCGGLALLSTGAIYFSAFKAKDIHLHHLRRMQERGYLGPGVEWVLLTMLFWCVAGLGAFWLLASSLQTLSPLMGLGMPARGAYTFAFIVTFLSLMAGLRDAYAKRREAGWQYEAVAQKIMDTGELGRRLSSLVKS